MKIAKRNSIICLMLAMVLSLIAAMFFTTVKVSAHEEDTADFFTVIGSGESSFADDKLIISLEDGAFAQSYGNLYLSDFEMVVEVSGEYEKLEFTLSYNSAIATGNKVVNGETVTYETEMQKTYALKSGANTITITADDNGFVYGDEAVCNDAEIFAGNFIGQVGFKLTGDNATIKVASIDQKASDTEGLYKQTFVKDADGHLTHAQSVVLLDSAAYNGTATDVVALEGQKISVSFVDYSVCKSSKTTSSSIKAGAEDNSGVYVWESGKYIAIDKVGTSMFNAVIGDKTVATFTIEGVTGDEVAPDYSASDEAYESFKNALYEATFDDYDGVKAHIRLGASNYLTIPSMEDLISDNVTAYSNLTYTVYYCNSSTDWTSATALKIPVAVEGTYKFFVIFKDKSGNALEKDDFIDEDGNVLDKYSKYVFDFELVNDAPIVVKDVAQDKAYKGITYTATAFTILAKDYTSEYTLYYSKDGSTNWVEIPALDDMEEDSADYKKYSAYAYDGKLTFTPANTGTYRIAVDVYENGTLKEPTRAETVITAAKAPVRVIPNESNWLLNNAWSLVFLGLGTLSLIGLICVLCIKPKE